MNSVISTEALIAKFREALDDNWGYIWGTAGEEWTAAKQKELEKTTDSDRANGRKYGSKWIGHMVADCSGLFSWAFKQLGGYMYHGSNTMYLKYCENKGQLSKGKRTDGKPLLPGTAVFVWNGEKYSHVGLYVGDGIVIEAMGTISGVTTTKVTAGKWTHWGELKGVNYVMTPTNDAIGTNDDAIETPKTIRKGAKGELVIKAQELLRSHGYSLGKWGVDGDFGSATENAVKAFQRDNGLTADGIIGPKTWAALMSSSGTYTFIVRGITKSEADALMLACPTGEVIKE